MRRQVLALLLATGCNYVFGLDKGQRWDAAPPPEGLPVRPVHLFWEIGSTDAQGKPAAVEASCMPMLPDTACASIIPIGSEQAHPEVPTIQVGPQLDDSGTDLGALVDAPYNVNDGSFLVPAELLGRSWRAVYQLPGDAIPHEVQWAAQDGELDIPRTTRAGAAPPPPNSGYSIAPMNGPQFAAPTIATSGSFTYGLATPDATGYVATYPFASAVPLAGPAGAPDPSAGDWVLLTEFAARSSDESSVDGWAVANLPLASGMLSMAQPMWHAPGPTSQPIDLATAPNEIRLTNALGNLRGSSGFDVRWTYGLSPNVGVFGFAQGDAPDYLERPLLVPIDVLAPTAVFPDMMTYVAIDPAAVPLDRVLYAALSNTRVVGASCPAPIANLALTSAIAVMTDMPAGATVFPAALARNERFADQNISDADCTTIPASAGVMDLSWQPDDGLPQGGVGYDDFEVALYEVVPGSKPSLKPLRTYRVASPLVHVDGSLLQAGTTYVFEITTHWGLPKAMLGNYRAVRPLPWGSSTKFAGAVTIQ